MLVDGDPLVWKRVDQRRFRREGRVEEVAVSQAVGFGDGGDRARVRGEIQGAGRRGVFFFRELLHAQQLPSRLIVEFDDALPGEVVRTGLPVLPPVDSGEGNAYEVCELLLRQPPDVPGVLDPLWIVVWQYR